MPRVQVATGPQLREAPLQGGYQQPIDQGRTLREAGAALSGAVDQVGAAVERVAERDAQIEANGADVKITEGWLKWDAENRQKYRGETVGGYEAAATKFWEEAKTEYQKSISPRARVRVNEALDRKRLVSMNSVMGYVNVEKEKHADETAAARIGTAIQFGVTTGDLTGTADQVRGIVAEVGGRKGWKTEQVQAEQQRYLGTMHLAQISKLSQVDAAAAQAYYSEAKQRGEIPFTAQAGVESTLKGELDNQEASKFAASVAPLPFAEQLSKASEIKDPARREKVIRHLKENQGIKVAARQEQEKAYSDQAWQLVGQGRKVPELTLANMDGKERVQLQDYLRQRAEHRATEGNKPVKTDPIVQAELLDMQARDPEKFKALRMTAYAYKLGGTDLEQLAKAQRDMLNPKAEKDVVGWNNKVTGRIEMLGITDTKHAERRGAFRVAAQKEFEAFTARTGKPPAPKDEEAILDGLMVPGKGAIFSKQAKTYAESVATGLPFELKNDADYDKLPRGARFVAPDGTTRVKP